ncbi:hypothetical protein GGR54DRAFT_166858 [Hypoxylon sp. NC1633]|nr:hypothetical protein GGR54DRAFT_166858 [Hypoxylon sp. NC1633]
MATPTPSKSMSSRLLTMKFMQRAVASTPSSSSPTTPNFDEQASKRRKVSHNTSRDSSELVAEVNQAAVQAAIAEEERKRQEALVQRAAELGDARWVLDIPDQALGLDPDFQTPLKVVQVGFAQIDSQIDSPDGAGLDAESSDVFHTRTPFVRKYNMKTKQAPKDSESESDDSSSDSDSDASSRAHGAGRFAHRGRMESRSDSPRTGIQSKRSIEHAKAKQLAEKRRKKEVKLNSPRAPPISGGMLSISSGGSSSLRQPPTVACYRCGRQGHKVADCKSPPMRTAR